MIMGTAFLGRICMKDGPIIIIDDDHDDQDLLHQVIRELGYRNPIHFFDICKDALAYLCNTTESPFIIFCDINLPRQSGLSFKKEIDETPYLRRKSIPFIFYSTSADQGSVDKAYMEFTIQGFFKKSDSYDGIKQLVSAILTYWTICVHPNT